MHRFGSIVNESEILYSELQTHHQPKNGDEAMKLEANNRSNGYNYLLIFTTQGRLDFFGEEKAF